MRLLAVHPSALMHTRGYLRLEPVGLELVAAAARRAGHDVQLVDLQVERTRTISPGWRAGSRTLPYEDRISCKPHVRGGAQR